MRTKRAFKAEIREVRHPILTGRENGSVRIYYDVPITLNEPPKDWWDVWRRTYVALQFTARADEDNNEILLTVCDDPDFQESCCKQLLESIDTANREYRLRFHSVYRKGNDLQKKIEEILLPKKKGKSWKRSDRLSRLLMGVKYPDTAGIQNTQDKAAGESYSAL